MCIRSRVAEGQHGDTVAADVAIGQQQFHRALGLGQPGQRGRARRVDDEDRRRLAALAVVRSFGDPAMQVQVLDQLTEQGKLPYGIKFAAEAAANGREADAAALAEVALMVRELEQEGTSNP
jgi:hypothetical protein